MSRRHSVSIPLLGLLAAVGSLAVYVPIANSNPAPVAETSDNERQLLERVATLETRVAVLEDRIRRLVEQGERTGRFATGNAHDSRGGNARQDGVCFDPRYLDDKGIWRIRTECRMWDDGDPCEPPFVIDSTGIKRIKMTCL